MATNRLLRHITEVRSLRVLARGQAVSRADIARELGLTRATVGYAVSGLIDAGLAQEVAEPAAEGRKGRPSVGVKLDPRGAYFLGIDIGTRVLTTVLVDLAMNVVARQVVPSGPAFRDPGQTAARLLPGALAVLDAAGIAADRVQGIGVSVPGIVRRDGLVVNAPFLEWSNYPLRAALAPALPEGWALEVCNDAFAFANAERAALGEDAAGDLFLMLMAEGIGGAMVADGRVMTGAHGFAGEVGHLVIAVADRVAPFEALGGARLFADLLPADQPVADSVAAILARQREPAMSARLDLWAEAMAAGLATVVHLFDPGRIVLGGPVAALFACRAGRLVARLQDRLLPGFLVPQLSVARFGAEGAAIGAAATLREELFVLPELDPELDPGLDPASDPGVAAG